MLAAAQEMHSSNQCTDTGHTSLFCNLGMPPPWRNSDVGQSVSYVSSSGSHFRSGLFHAHHSLTTCLSAFPHHLFPLPSAVGDPDLTTAFPLKASCIFFSAAHLAFARQSSKLSSLHGTQQYAGNKTARVQLSNFWVDLGFRSWLDLSCPFTSMPLLLFPAVLDHRPAHPEGRTPADKEAEVRKGAGSSDPPLVSNNGTQQPSEATHPPEPCRTTRSGA